VVDFLRTSEINRLARTRRMREPTEIRSDLQAAIIGGGIGGLTAAIALRQVGVAALVYERAPKLEKVGAGLTLWPNAMAALGMLGLAEAVAATGGPIVESQVRTWNGRVLAAMPVGRVSKKLGAKPVCIHRADLQRVLLEALGEGVVQLGFECIRFQQDEAGVIARFANGKEAQADLLIGADGLHSAVRAQLLGHDKPRYAGYTAWRGITLYEDQALSGGISFVSWGRGREFGALSVGRGRVYWFGTTNAPEGSPDAAVGRKQEVLETFRGWHEPIEALIGATEAPAILRNDVYDRKPVKRWGEGRVTLLGDAAHPSTPNLGQGACQAIEDAVVLARCLVGETGVVPALRKYERERRARTAYISRMSWRNGQMERWEDPLACGMRNALVRLLPAWLMRRMTERMWRFDGQ
jgi:2-polyprenyl-6-methoxyphenol hydroxylase-like FAD-dependent oxidoreductase